MKIKMKEYFVVTNSFAAPFFSDTDKYFIKGKTPFLALRKAVDEYSHPCGLYAANLYTSADDYYKGKKRLAYYKSNVVIAQEKLTKGKGGYSIKHTSKNKNIDILEIDHQPHEIKNPRKGKCYLEIKEANE